jgi:predicted Ser/Thr protein kinase
MEALAGRYRLGREIARGAIGTVWRGVDTQSDEPVAIKLLRPEAAEQDSLAEAFRAEAEILRELDHPSVVRPRDYVGEGDVQALVLDLIDGEDLRRRLRRDGPVPPSIAVNVVAQVADALAYLHAQGVVHGDIKPGNLLVPADGQAVRLIDFGVARRMSDPPPTAIHATPEYVPPEVVEGAPPSPAADVYALGVVLYELLCGRSPFRGGGPLQVLRRHGTCTPVPPPGLPPVVWPIIEDCLAADPERRPDAKLIGARLRGVEPALEGAPALPPLSPDQITWWPRPTGPAAAVAKVTWVPLTAAPVSPASAYAGRMVAIPIAGVGPQHLDPAYGTASPWPSRRDQPDQASPRPRRGRFIVAGGGGAAALVVLAFLGGLAVAGGERVTGTVPATRITSPAPAITSATPAPLATPDTRGWPGIGDPMPPAPPLVPR